MTKKRSKLKKARIDKRLSQQALADLIKVHKDSVSNWECGKTLPTLRNARELCRVLDVDHHTKLDIFYPDDETSEEMPCADPDLAEREETDESSRPIAVLAERADADESLASIVASSPQSDPDEGEITAEETDKRERMGATTEAFSHEESLLSRAEALGLIVGSRDIMTVGNAVTSSQEPPMSDLIIHELLTQLSSRFTRILDTWPRRNYRYEELQDEINKAVAQHCAIAGQDATSALTRRDSLKSLGLLLLSFCGLDAGKKITLAKIPKDTENLLIYSAAGIAACWHLRRGTDIQLAYQLVAQYIPILQGVLSSQSEAHRKAAAKLLNQSFTLKSSLAKDIENSHQAIVYGEQAIQHGIRAEDPVAQAIAHRMMCNVYYPQENYAEAVRSAERAVSLINGNMDTGTQSFIYAGLASSQSADGQADNALVSLKKARDLFDPTAPTPIHVQFSPAILAVNSGAIYRDLGHWAAAVKDFDEAIASPDASALGKVQASIERAKIEACRDDKPRKMDEAIRFWKQGMNGAKELNSRRYINEARRAHSTLLAAWPGEEEIKKLREDF